MSKPIENLYIKFHNGETYSLPSIIVARHMGRARAIDEGTPDGPAFKAKATQYQNEFIHDSEEMASYSLSMPYSAVASFLKRLEAPKVPVDLEKDWNEGEFFTVLDEDEIWEFTPIERIESFVNPFEGEEIFRQNPDGDWETWDEKEEAWMPVEEDFLSQFEVHKAIDDLVAGGPPDEPKFEGYEMPGEDIPDHSQSLGDEPI
jgi:hypothetical protein